MLPDSMLVAQGQVCSGQNSGLDATQPKYGQGLANLPIVPIEGCGANL